MGSLRRRELSEATPQIRKLSAKSFRKDEIASEEIEEIPMQVGARLKGAKISARKARLVTDQIRGKDVGEALDILSFSTKKGAHLVKKLLESAIANAEHNAGADIDDLTVSCIFVDEGKTMKRIKPRAKGRADRILKRSCHITIKVAEK